jgi:lysophospholipase L1-like esterase
MGGTNDILLEAPLPSVEQNMAAMMDMLVTLHKPVMIGLPLLTRPESALYGWQTAGDVKRHNDAITQYRQWLEKAAISRQYDAVDFYQALLEGEQRLGFSLYADGIHPTAAGYTVLAEAVLPVLVNELPGLMPT